MQLLDCLFMANEMIPLKVNSEFIQSWATGMEALSMELRGINILTLFSGELD